MFNFNHKVAQELFWYSEDGNGLALFNKAKAWCSEQKIEWMLASETGGGTPQLEAVYKRLGLLVGTMLPADKMINYHTYTSNAAGE